MSLTKITRRLVALATDAHVRSLRLALKAHSKATAAASAAWSQAIQLERHAEQAYTDTLREELQALARYEDEIIALGRDASELDH